MKESIRRRLEKTVERFEEVGALLADPGVIAKQGQFRELSMEYSRLESVARRFGEFSRLEGELRAAEDMVAGADLEMRELAADEVRELRERLAAEDLELTRLLIPKDPRDDSNIFLEIRAGTGGDEAAIFAGDLFRMYSRYAERQGWKVEVLSESAGEHGGYRRSSAASWARARIRSSSSNRARTACSVCRQPRRRAASTRPPAPSPSCRNSTRSRTCRSIRPNCASTRSARRAPAASTSTRPTRRSASRTSRRASWSNARTNARSTRTVRAPCHCCGRGCSRPQRSKQTAQQAQERKLQVGTGDRSERIRTYNFPQGRVTDHRINLTLYQLAAVMEGALADVIGPLQQEWQAEQLAQLE